MAHATDVVADVETCQPRSSQHRVELMLMMLELSVMTFDDVKLLLLLLPLLQCHAIV